MQNITFFISFVRTKNIKSKWIHKSRYFKQKEPLVNIRFSISWLIDRPTALLLLHSQFTFVREIQFT